MWTRPVAVPTPSLKGALMSPLYRRFVVLAVGFLLLLTPLASAAAVEALFDLASTVTGPFPSDRFTLFDHDNKTGLRMNLPKLNCSTRPTDCADGVLDSARRPVGGRAFKDFLDDDRDGDGDDGHDRDSDHRRHRDSDRRLAAYRDELRDAVKDARLRDRYIVAASVFTTQSATAVLEKIRQQIKSSHPAPATMLGTFARATVTAIDC